MRMNPNPFGVGKPPAKPAAFGRANPNAVKPTVKTNTPQQVGSTVGGGLPSTNLAVPVQPAVPRQIQPSAPQQIGSTVGGGLPSGIIAQQMGYSKT